MVSPEWTVHTKRRGSFTLAALTSEWPTLTVGREATVTFRLRPILGGTHTLYVPAGETHTVEAGTVEVYTDTVVDGTLVVNGELVRTGGFNYGSFLEWGGAVATDLDTFTLPAYREQLPTRAGGIDSLVLGFEPSTDLLEQTVAGFWGVVLGGTERTNPTFTDRQVEFRVYVLGWFREWDRGSIEEKMQA